MTKTIKARVKRGAEFLDERRSGWAAEINLEYLAMWSCTRCILGQLHGSFWEEPPMPGTDKVAFGLSWEKAVQLGFVGSDNPQSTINYNALADAWRNEIQARTHRKPHRLGAMQH